MTFIISAYIMSKVQGTFSVVQNFNSEIKSESVRDDDDDKKKKFAKIWSTLVRAAHGIETFINMTKDFVVYLMSSGFALCAFMKACGTMTWGTADVLNASFSFVEGDEEETSRRMGIIFSCAGFGCLIGPFISNTTITRGDQPNTLQLACIGAFIFLVTGWLGIANAPNFEVICAFTVLRCIGEAIIWMNATLLLQVCYIFSHFYSCVVESLLSLNHFFVIHGHL
jgi:hypothetical protein